MLKQNKKASQWMCMVNSLTLIEKKIAEVSTSMNYVFPFVTHSHFYSWWWFIKSLNWIVFLLPWSTNLHFTPPLQNASMNLVIRRHALNLRSRLCHSSSTSQQGICALMVFSPTLSHQNLLLDLSSEPVKRTESSIHIQKGSNLRCQNPARVSASRKTSNVWGENLG